MASNDDDMGSRKKRTSERQINQDNPEDDGVSDSEPGEFSKASQDVLQGRRLVKARRPGAAAAAGGKPPAVNPFAALKGIALPTPAAAEMTKKGDETEDATRGLVNTAAKTVDTGVKVGGLPSAEPESKPLEACSKQREEENQLVEAAAAKEPSESVLQPVDENDAHGKNENEKGDQDGDKAEPSAVLEEGTKVEAAKESDEKEGLSTEQARTSEESQRKPSASASPQPPSTSGFAAFSTAFSGAFGTTAFGSLGTSPASTAAPFSSGFSFGTGSSGLGFAVGKSDLPSLSSVFGSKSNGDAVSLFASPSIPAGGASGSISPFGGSTPAPLVSLSEVAVETGEESEKSVFTSEATLYEYVPGGGAWKERGKGELRLNVVREGEKDGRARLVMRSKGNFRLLLNAALYPDMKFTQMNGKSVTFICANGASQEKDDMGTFAVKLKESVDAFLKAVESEKGRGGARKSETAALVEENSTKDQP